MGSRILRRYIQSICNNMHSCITYDFLLCCHARMHGLMHDRQLWACPSCLLGLMYVLRWLYAIKCLRFQLVGDCIKAKPFLFPFSFYRILLLGKVFSILREFFPYLDKIYRCSQWPLHGHHLHTLHVLSFFSI